MAEPEEFADETAFIKAATITGIVGRKDLLLPLAHRRSYIEYVKAASGGPPGGYWNTPEGQQELAYWQSPSGQNALTSVDDANNMLEDLTSLITHYSDQSTVDCLKEKYGSLRDFFETSSPTTQCANTIRGVVPNNTTCWICGVKITGFPGAGEFRMLELSPECEHVFPIAQALCFSGLYEAQLYKQIAEETGKTEAEAYREGVTYEYQWAHRICNQIKNDTHFIGRDENYDFFIDDSLLDTFLTDLQRTPKYGGGANLMRLVKKTLGKDPEQWKAFAIETMKAVSTRLINYSKTSGLTPLEHSKVTLMSVRSFIATSPECGGMVERVPETQKNKLKASPGGLSQVDIAEAVAIAKHFIGRATEDLTAIMERTLDKLGRAISARERGALVAMLPDAGLVIREKLESEVTYLELNALRLQILYYLKSKYGDAINRPNNREPWSDFKVWTTHVIQAAIYQASVELLPAIAGTMPELAAFVRSDMLKADTTESINTMIAEITASGVPYTDIRAIDSNVDPAPAVMNPSWFKGPAGGSRLQPNPVETSNAGGSASVGARRRLFAGLRKRSGTVRAPGVRQRPRKSRTRRQRKPLGGL